MRSSARHSEKRALFELLRLQKINQSEVLGLKEAILRQKVSMIQDDIKSVQELIAELD